MFKVYKPILLALAFLLCALLFLTAYGKHQLKENQIQPVRPNIVLILTDDQDLRSIAFMPRLKALLIDQGTMFKNFFVNVPLCCPSRASILRGQYAHNHRVLTNGPVNGGFQKFHNQGLENSTIATWLQAAGYRTVLLGKYLNGYPGGKLTYIPPGWDEWYSPVDGDSHSKYNYKLNENGRIVEYKKRPEDYLTDVLAGKATNFIRRAANDSKPFFIYLATNAPHGPATPPIRYRDKFAGMKAPSPPSFNEQDVIDKPKYIRNRPRLSDSQVARLDNFYRNRLRSLLAVDDMISNLIETLKTTGTLENTYIFFTSDNGYLLGEHRMKRSKELPYEESIRVPMIVRGPGVPAGQVLEHFTGNIDLAPTFAELAGISFPDFVDGRSLVPLLHRKTSVDTWRQNISSKFRNFLGKLLHRKTSVDTWRQVFLIEHWGNITKIPDFQALRTKDYLYVEYETGERELYDLRTDPYQLQNLFTAAAPALIIKLSSRLSELRHCAGADCRAAEDRPLN